ncbi:MAG TPA: hypothetical protein VIY49_31425 [Bryobacteraceae bacterium]
MRHFVIIGRGEDPCCALVHECLTKLGQEVLFLDEGRLFPGLQLVWDLKNGSSQGAVGLGDIAIRLGEIDGVLARFSGFPVLKEEFRTPNGQYLCSEWHALMRGYLRALSCPVINRLRPELWYKPFLSIPDLVYFLPELKFKSPKTLVATSFEEAQAFFEECGHRIYYSPLTIPSRYTIESGEDLRKLATLSRLLPFHLREAIAGEAGKAYVVGTDVVWDTPSGEAMLEPAVQEHCLEIAASLGLTFCELHLLRSSDHEWYCLGIACMPDLFQCSDAGRATIAERLASALLNATSAAA